MRWSLDFTSDALANGRKFRTAALKDDRPRECLTIDVHVYFIDPGKPNQNAYTDCLKYKTPEEFVAARPFDKTQWAQTLELSEGSAPAPIAHAAE